MAVFSGATVFVGEGGRKYVCLGVGSPVRGVLLAVGMTITVLVGAIVGAGVGVSGVAFGVQAIRNSTRQVIENTLNYNFETPKIELNDLLTYWFGNPILGKDAVNGSRLRQLSEAFKTTGIQPPGKTVLRKKMRWEGNLGFQPGYLEFNLAVTILENLSQGQQAKLE